jgi:hypothetical protein
MARTGTTGRCWSGKRDGKVDARNQRCKRLRIFASSNLARNYRIMVAQVYCRYHTVLQTEKGHVVACRSRCTMTEDEHRWQRNGRHLLDVVHHPDSPQRQFAPHREQPSVKTRATAPGRHLRTLRLQQTG